MGKSLEEIFQANKKKFSMKSVCMIAEQILDRIEFIHNKHVIHRDIKPDNFVIGEGNKNVIIYILDFGLSKKYRSSRTLQHIRFTINKKLTGTARYASINALKGCEQSRRDDLEAIGYVLLYFLRGILPWQGIKVERREDRYKKIYEKKKDTTPEELCSGFPPELAEYVKYTRGLEFEQNPDYNYLRGLFRKIMEDSKYEYDLMFDWITEKPNIDEFNMLKKSFNTNTSGGIQSKGTDKEKDDWFDKNEEERNKKMEKVLGTEGVDRDREDTKDTKDKEDTKEDTKDKDHKDHKGKKKKKDGKCLIF
ncbi:MAG: casein kinase 1 family protein [archaeon]|nr:casein kinase 1 family protein [archaeon]